MNKLKTDKVLLKALRKSSTRAPTAKELHDQRVSFIMGSLKEPSNVTRSRVEQVLAQQEGKKARK